jgi:glycosyltransferase involved in cell wall biosynthesis
MNKKVLIFFPNNCFPPLHGSHHRCIQQINDLKHSYELYFASTREFSDTKWSPSIEIYRSAAKKYGIHEVKLFEDSLAGRIDSIVGLIIWKFYLKSRIELISNLRRYMQKAIMIAWFTQLRLTIKPSTTIVHYTRWGHLSCFPTNQHNIIELHDILPIQSYLLRETREAIKNRRKNLDFNLIPWPCYIENIDQLPICVSQKIIQDIAILNRFDLVWMISKREDKLLIDLGLTTKSVIIYPSIETSGLNFNKQLPPLLPLGPNAFNVYSVIHFVRSVLPYINADILKSMSIHVSGSLGSDSALVKFNPPIHHVGFVDDYLKLLAKSCLMLAPTAVGTGQQVKIFESLAVGTPVLAYKSAVPHDVLAENPCIMAANNDEEFARYLSDFATNKDLREKYATLAAQSASKQAELIKSRPYSVSLKRVLARLVR